MSSEMFSAVYENFIGAYKKVQAITLLYFPAENKYRYATNAISDLC